jgi:hypothetical protein
MEPIKQDILIRQGASYRGKSLLLAGNYSDWEFAWQIKKKHKGTLLAEGDFEIVNDDFVIGNITYENHTLITPILDFQVTIELPGAMGKIPGQDAWVYDCEMKSPDGLLVHRFFEGLANVSPEVTTEVIPDGN